MQVFISHGAADAALARRVASALAEAGFTVWDPESVLPGDNWASAVGKALESSELMVVLCTRDGRGSSTLTREVQYALTSGNYRGRVVPVLVNFPMTYLAGKDLPWALLRMNPVHFNDRIDLSDSDVSEIVTRVSAVAREGANAPG
jgi:hypothetical protein